MRTIIALVCFLFASLFMVNVLSQTHFFEHQYNTVHKGLHMDIGIQHALGMNRVLLANQRKEKDDVERKLLHEEWNNPRLGIFFDFSYNFSDVHPFFLGLSFKWQSLYRSNEEYIRTLFIEDFIVPDVFWEYKKNAGLFNYSLYSEFSFINEANWSLFARGEVGLAHYRNDNRVTWSMNRIDSVYRVPLDKTNLVTWSSDIGLGLRWQFSKAASLKGHIGYQFQGRHNFTRRKEVDAMYVTLNDQHLFPENNDFTWHTPSIDLPAPFIQKEFLYLQVGLSFNLSSNPWPKDPDI